MIASVLLWHWKRCTDAQAEAQSQTRKIPSPWANLIWRKDALSVDHTEIILGSTQRGGSQRGNKEREGVHDNSVSLSLLPTFSHANQSIKAEKWCSVVERGHGESALQPPDQQGHLIALCIMWQLPTSRKKNITLIDKSWMGMDSERRVSSRVPLSQQRFP